MEISVTGQAMAFLGALILGAAIGLLYDLFRVLRVRVPVKGLGSALDLLFWTAVTGALFLYAVISGNGEVRAFLILGVLAGSAVYFAQLSRLVLRLAYLGADFLALLGKLCLLPMKLAVDLGKKSCTKMKKDFHYYQKWYKINFNINQMEQMTQRDGFGEGGTHRWSKSKKPDF